MGKVVIIEQFDEGFMVVGGDGKTSAIESPDTLIRRLEKEFGFSGLAKLVPDNPDLKDIAAGVGKIITSPPIEIKRPEAEARPKTEAEAAFLSSVVKKPEPEQKEETTRDKVLKLAKEQIDITGKWSASKIAKELGKSQATVSYHLDRLTDELAAYLNQHEEDKYRRQLRPNTTIGADGEKIEQDYIDELEKPEGGQK